MAKARSTEIAIRADKPEKVERSVMFDFSIHL